ncbi:hypothetical protein FRC11_013540, partial [Ceratobasidium sp. 423]
MHILGGGEGGIGETRFAYRIADLGRRASEGPARNGGYTWPREADFSEEVLDRNQPEAHLAELVAYSESQEMEGIGSGGRGEYGELGDAFAGG